jgi:Na+-transporting NADH:ubiquinone oxidoreductase subunit C
MNKESIGNTFFVAITLCLVCSALVSIAAVSLKPLQVRNKALDKKKNILMVAGLYDPRETNIAEVFSSRLDDHVIDLETGQDVTDEYPKGPGSFDAEASLEVKGEYETLDPRNDPAVLKKRENRAHVYVVKRSASDPTPQLYIFPIRGKGLWSTLKGFIALDVDLTTIRGLTYYEHAETPGLGGEVDNPEWKQKWDGKIAFDASGNVVVNVSKTASGPSDVDALSGATITSNGVEAMIKYWLGDDAFGPYLDRLKSQGSEQAGAQSSQGDDGHG